MRLAIATWKTRFAYIKKMLGRSACTGDAFSAEAEMKMRDIAGGKAGAGRFLQAGK